MRRLLASPIAEQYGALVEIGGALSETEKERIFEFVAPFWIEDRAATKCLEAHEAEAGHRALVANGELANFTPMMFARRHAAHKEWKDRKLLPGEEDGELLPLAGSHTPIGRSDTDLRKQALRSILHQLGLGPDATPDEIKEQFRKHHRKRKAVYSILTGIENDDLEDLAPIVEELGDAVFIILTGSSPIDIPEQYEDLFRALDPPFRTGADQLANNPTRNTTRPKPPPTTMSSENTSSRNAEPNYHE